MSDAIPHNFPMLDERYLARWVICLCLAHGRRQFVELVNAYSDPNAQVVVDIVATVYHNEAHCKRGNLSPEQRLAYHQQHSADKMEALRIWFNNQLQFKQVEPNSPMGRSIIYMLKRWHELTQFLRIAGVALDNNICEQAIKVFIRYRKNSTFYRTFKGACVGDAMMSVLHTAAHHGVNILDYLSNLQIHADQVQANPHVWMPWCYEKTLQSYHDSG